MEREVPMAEAANGQADMTFEMGVACLVLVAIGFVLGAVAYDDGLPVHRRVPSRPVAT